MLSQCYEEKIETYVVGHVTTEARARLDSILGVDVVQVIPDIFPSVYLDEIMLDQNRHKHTYTR